MAIHRLLDKLHNDSGETLLETLVAILVAALSVALLFTCITASTEINKKAREMDKSSDETEAYKGYYDALTRAERQDASPAPSATVTVTGGGVGPSPGPVTVEVNLYGGKGMYSYKEKEAP